MDVHSEKACLIMALLPILLQVAQLGGLHLIFIYGQYAKFSLHGLIEFNSMGC